MKKTQFIFLFLIATSVSRPLSAYARGPKCDEGTRAACTNHWEDKKRHHLMLESNLRIRESKLPSEIADLQSQKNNVETEIRTTHDQIASVRSNQEVLSANIGSLTQVINAIASSKESLRSLTVATKDRIPFLVERIRLYLNNQENFLQKRLAEIDAEIEQKFKAGERDSFDALIFEKARIREITLFVQNRSPNEVREQINLAISGKTILKGISPETLLLFEEAAKSFNAYKNGEDAASALEQNLQRVIAATETTKAENLAKIDQNNYQLQLHQNFLGNKEPRLAELKAAIAVLEAERDSIPRALEIEKNHLYEIHIFYQCCDNQPYCQMLHGPKDGLGYESYAQKIRNNNYDNRCVDNSDFLKGVK